MEKVQVAVVDDYNLLSEAISGLVNSFENFEVIYTCKHGQDLLKKLRSQEEKPEIVLMDIQMPILNGYETTAILRKDYPLIKVIGLTVEDSERSILRMLKAGARGYLLKDTEKDILEKSLIEVYESGYYYTAEISSVLISALAGNIEEIDFTLKPKELEFLRLVCSDLSYREIADIMCLSPKTIDNYRERLFQKFRVKSRIGLVIFLLKNKIVNLD